MLKTQILHNGEIVEGRVSDLEGRRTTVWVDITDPQSQDWDMVSSHVGAESYELVELLDPHQRPTILDIGNFTAIMFQAFSSEKTQVQIKSILFLVSKEQKDFITIHQGPVPALEKIRTYPMRRRVELFTKGSTALLFAALSEISGQGYDVVDQLSEEIGRLEQQVFEPKSSTQVMKKIFQLKKGLIYFQRALTLDREVIFGLEKAYGRFLDAKSLADFRLLHSDTTQLIDLAATYRDIIISTVEVHLSSISNNLNVVMKRLTAWAAIILVPSLVAGIYGMNFVFLPLARHPNGFWIMVGLMAASVVALYSYFKRNDWI